MVFGSLSFVRLFGYLSFFENSCNRVSNVKKWKKINVGGCGEIGFLCVVGGNDWVVIVGNDLVVF